MTNLCHPRSKQRLCAIGPIAIVLLALEALAFGSPGKTTVQAVSEGLTCQCGCGLTVANCNHPQCEFSVPVRQQIEVMISRGIGRGEIIGLFQAKYGEKILSAPTSEGFNLLAWVMPFGAVFVGCFIIVIAISRWRANQFGEANALESSIEPDPELKRRLEAEILESR